MDYKCPLRWQNTWVTHSTVCSVTNQSLNSHQTCCFLLHGEEVWERKGHQESSQKVVLTLGQQRCIPENSVLTEVSYLLPDLQHPELLSLNCSLKKALLYSCEKKKINRDMVFYPSSSSSSDSVIPLNSNNALNGHNKNCNFKEPSNTCSPFSVQALAKLVWFLNSSVIWFQTVMAYNAKCYLLSFSFLSIIINRELTQGSNIKTKSTWPIQTLQRHC